MCRILRAPSHSRNGSRNGSALRRIHLRPGLPYSRQGSALFLTGTIHNIVHLATGALALAIACILPAGQQVNGVFGFSVLYLVIFVALIVSPNLFGILSYPVNLADQLLHVGLAAVSFAVAWMARNGGYTSATA